MQIAIYRRCACLELNKLKSPLKVDERSVDILTSSLQRRFPNHLFMLTPGNTDWGYTV